MCPPLPSILERCKFVLSQVGRLQLAYVYASFLPERNSEIWRSLPRQVRDFIAAVALTPEQGSFTSIVAATTRDVHQTYLQPYWMPNYVKDSVVPFPVLECHGPYVGSRPTTPRLPPNADAAGTAMWSASEQLTTERMKKRD
jgi:hypothetical protein